VASAPVAAAYPAAAPTGYTSSPYGAAGYGAPGYGAPSYNPGYPPAYGYGAPPYGYPAGTPMVAVPTYYTPEPLCKTLAKQATGARWGAACMDFFLIFFIWLGLFFFVYPTMFPLFNPIRILITFTLWYGYYGVLDGLRGATLGKSALGLKVVKADLSQATLGQGLVRALELLIWPLSFIIVLIVQLVLLDGGGQGIGDKMAKTYVVKKADLAQYAQYLQAPQRAPY